MSSVAEAFVTVRPDMRRFGPLLGAGLAGMAGIAAAGAATIGAAFTAVAIDGVRQFGQFERQMNEVFTLLPGISERAMGQMQDDVRALSVEIGITTDEMVPALYQAISAGVPRDNVFDFLRIAGEAAIGGVTDIETAVDGITSVVNAFGEETIDAQRAADLMFTAVRLGKTDFEQLSDRLFQVNPLAAALGVNFEDVTAAMATMTAQGTPTRVAATQLRGMFQELSREGGQAAGIFEDIAGKSFQEFIAAGNDTADAIDLLREASEKTGVPLQDMFSTVEGGMAALQLATDDGDAFREVLEEMSEAAGATEEAFRQMDTGSARAWERLSIGIHNVRIAIGEQLAPFVERFVDWLVENMPAIETAVGDAFESIADWIENVGLPAWQNFYEALQDAWPAIQELAGSLMELFAALGQLIGSVFGDAADVVGSSTDSQTSDMSDLAQGINDLAETLSALARASSRVTGEINAHWNILAGAVTRDTNRVEEAMLDLNRVWGGKLAEMLTSMARFELGVKERIDAVVEWFRGLPDRIVRAFPNPAGMLLRIGREIMGGLLSGLRERWDDVRGFLGEVTRNIPRIKGPIDVDRKMLEPAGEAIFQGLGRGMDREWANIERKLGIVTADIPAAMTAPNWGGVSVGPGGMTHVTVNLGGEQLTEILYDSLGRVKQRRDRLTAGAGAGL